MKSISRIAYLINQYPKVSHSFIRREIIALENLGFDVIRISLRGWDAELVDDADIEERKRTRYALRSPVRVFVSVLALVAGSPLRFLSALRLAFRMSRNAERPLLFHLAYLAEACLILRWMSELNVTHTHAHFGTNSAEVAMLVRELGGPGFSFTAHGPTEFDKPMFLGIGEKIRRSEFVVAISSFGRGQLCRWVEHEHWAKIKVVHCGLDEAFYDVPPAPIPNVPRLVCVGRLCGAKGQLLLVEAIRCLATRGIAPDVVLAGDGEMRDEIARLVSRYGLENKIRITGWISSSQVRDEILAAQCMVLPSFAEGLPVVIMEAMALRRPVLTTYVAGIPELVKDGENGWLFPAGSVDELALAIERFLNTPIETLDRMGKAGRKRVLERHSISVEADRLAKLIRQASHGEPSQLSNVPRNLV
jgi:glycosyltransferase involved in cell wall biosynthesis